MAVTGLERGAGKPITINAVSGEPEDASEERLTGRQESI
jgi:hypothetical protein